MSSTKCQEAASVRLCEILVTVFGTGLPQNLEVSVSPQVVTEGCAWHRRRPVHFSQSRKKTPTHSFVAALGSNQPPAWVAKQQRQKKPAWPKMVFHMVTVCP